jgi:aryl-phospho-beta-D-glucosidase BglC (GH1 family)
MKITSYLNVSVLLMTIIFFASCKNDDVTPELTVTPLEISLKGEGDTSQFSIVTNDSWTIQNAADAWLQVSQVTGNSGSASIQIIASKNATGNRRSTVVVVDSNNGQRRRINVSQYPTIYPSYNTSPKAPDATGMSSNAVELAAKMKLGWNIGNTFEAPGGETGWGSPVITEDYVKFVKANGFNAIRIPCAWDWHHVDVDSTAHIDQNWMNRVKEVVGYCVSNDIYVLLNIHWDGGWLEKNIKNITPVKQDSIDAKQRAFWEQIATAMRASANEPDAGNAAETKVLAQFHQTFIDAVRSTGGRNSYRVLVLQGPGTNMALTSELMSTLPKDPTPNRLMVEVHNYSPSQFCFLNEDVDWGKMAYYWGKDYQSSIEPDRNFLETWEWGNEAALLSDFKKVKEAFVDKGVPVLIGEYGAYRRDGQKNEPKDLVTHNNSVDYWITLATKQARQSGMIPFWWDIGAALDRTTLTVKDQRTIDAIIAGSK